MKTEEPSVICRIFLRFDYFFFSFFFLVQSRLLVFTLHFSFRFHLLSIPSS
jgi:hypothetical protein